MLKFENCAACLKRHCAKSTGSAVTANASQIVHRFNQSVAHQRLFHDHSTGGARLTPY
jgi:hypothetical protein